MPRAEWRGRRLYTAAKPIGVAWQLAVSGDLSLPDFEGPRPLSMRIANRYVDRLQAAAESTSLVASLGVTVSRSGHAHAPLSL